MSKEWFKEAIIYQIYPRSFKDSNGDGIGDLRGVIEKIDYLHSLGINAIWFSPIYSSPNADNGYDISDYQNIMEEFGTMEDFDFLLDRCKKLNIKVIMDLVVNHTSDEHRWFVESKKSKDNDKSDYYIWRDSKNGKEPNNWESFFSGSAWKWCEDRKQYYLHLFNEKQPDLNWKCEALKKEIFDMIEWWIKKGVDGFRIDAISYLAKPEGLPDSTKPATHKDGYVLDPEITANLIENHKLINEMNIKLFSKYSIPTVGEVSCVTPQSARDYVLESRKEFDMIIPFIHPQVEIDTWSVEVLRNRMREWYEALKDGGWWAQFLSNHDKPRQVSLYGNDKEYRVESAKLIATIIHTSYGTPFIYQGEEIGMTNAYFDNIEDYDDVDMKSFYYKLTNGISDNKEIENIFKKLQVASRDNARTPMQWDSSEYAGFSTSKPWIKVNPNYKDINVEKDIENKNSIYHYYKKLISLRKNNKVIVYGDYKDIYFDDSNIFAYERNYNGDRIIIINNFSNRSSSIHLDYNIKEILLSNYNIESLNTSKELKPYESIVFRVH